jgi:hypothetical protein
MVDPSWSQSVSGNGRLLYYARIAGRHVTEPKAFISYAWTNDEHVSWVVQLASDLRAQGVDVILDKWDLKEGHDANAFMERMVTDETVSKVIMVCDAAYADKANKRSGGVGTEAQIISAKLYAKRDQDKFVAVVREKDAEGHALVPVFYASRIHIDLSEPELYGPNVEQLLRWIFDKPLFVKPPIGKRPSYLDQPDEQRTGNSALHRAALDALKRQSPSALMLVEDYLGSVVEGLETHRIPQGDDAQKFDDQLDASLARFSPTKNELIELFGLVCRTHDNEDAHRIVVRFFEGVARYQVIPDNVSHYHEGDWDNFKFIASELYLSLIATLIKREKFGFVSAMLDALYFERGRHGGAAQPHNFTLFAGYLPSVDHRNQRRKLGRTSLKADWLNERCKGSGIEFAELMQAEFVLFLRSNMDAMKTEKVVMTWWPQSLCYIGYRDGPLELFARAASAAYFERIKPLLGVATVAEFKDLVPKIDGPRYNHSRLQVAQLANVTGVASQR